MSNRSTIDWASLVNQHGPLVWQTCYRLLNHEADTADCFQQVFLAAMQRVQHEAVTYWPALLKKMATARALDQLRSRYRQYQRTQPIHGQPLIDDRLYDPSNYAMEGELADELRQALSELEPVAAEIFCLANLEGWSHETIAQQWGMTSNHIGVIISRVRAALRKKLEAHVPGPLTTGELT